MTFAKGHGTSVAQQNFCCTACVGPICHAFFRPFVHDRVIPQTTRKQFAQFARKMWRPYRRWSSTQEYMLQAFRTLVSLLLSLDHSSTHTDAGEVLVVLARDVAGVWYDLYR